MQYTTKKSASMDRVEINKMGLRLFSLQGDTGREANRKLQVKKAYVDSTSPNISHSEATTPELVPKKTTIPTSEAEYESFANEVLFHLYPKFCPEHKVQLTRLISTRNYAVKCPHCRHQQSRFSYTPMHHMKVPLYMWGWCLWESIHRFPQVLTSSEIVKRLGVAKNTGLLLKRRLQLFAAQQTPRIKELMSDELKNRFEGIKLPNVAENRNVEEVLQGRPVPQVDTCVLYSASQRANKGRARHRHTGMTSSIYMSPKLGGRQVGTLVNTLSWKKGPLILDSIGNNRAETLRPLLDKYIPKDVPVFTDEGFRFYNRINRNFRMVNHNRKSADPRYKWSRQRWSKNGVHCQVAEGVHRIMKYNFAAYGWIRPENSQLYLNEFAFLKSLKYYGWDKLILSEEENRKVAEERKFTGCEASEQKSTESLQQKVANNRNGLIEKTGEDGSKQRGRVKGQPDQETGFVGQNNGVIEDRNQGFERAGTNCTGTGEPGFRRFYFAEVQRGVATPSGPQRAGASAGVKLLRKKMCEILDSNQ